MIIREAGRSPLSVPEPLFRLVLGRFGLPRLPRGALAHIKYPVVIDSSSFRDKTGFSHKYDEYAAIREYREANAS